MGLWPGNKNKSEENKRLLVPLYVVTDSGAVNGPYYTRREAANAHDAAGECATVVQAANPKSALKARPFI